MQLDSGLAVYIVKRAVFGNIPADTFLVSCSLPSCQYSEAISAKADNSEIASQDDVHNSLTLCTLLLAGEDDEVESVTLSDSVALLQQSKKLCPGTFVHMEPIPGENQNLVEWALPKQGLGLYKKTARTASYCKSGQRPE